MASSKDVGLYAFTLASRPSGSNANAQLILPGENFLREILINFNLNYHQKTQKFQSVKQSSFC